MQLVHKRNIIRSVRDRWNEQYPSDDYRFADGRFAGPIRLKLAALNLETCSSDEVDRAIGRRSWAENQCDECGNDCETLVRVGEEPDYEARWQDLCADCLQAALRLVKPL